MRGKWAGLALEPGLEKGERAAAPGVFRCFRQAARHDGWPGRLCTVLPAWPRRRAAGRQGGPGGSGRRWEAERSRPEAKRQTQTGFLTLHLP